jgi:S1-C subfamily serine protease
MHIAELSLGTDIADCMGKRWRSMQAGGKALKKLHQHATAPKDLRVFRALSWSLLQRSDAGARLARGKSNSQTNREEVKRKERVMFRKLIGAATVLALLPLPAAARDSWEIFQQVRPSLVQVVGVGANGRFHMGSGVSLPNGTVVTSCHVTLAAKRVMLFGGARGEGAQLQAADVAHDICALYFPEVLQPPAVVSSSRSLKIGDPVYAVGFNAGRSVNFQSGEVVELFEHDGGMVIRTTAAFTHGASGGGLFDQEGRLVGILTFFRTQPGGTSYFAVPTEWLHALDKSPAQEVGPLAGIPFWAEQTDRQPAFLQAAVLEADHRWEDLLTLARGWTSSRPDDGQAWLALGKASLNTGESAVARDAFRRASELGVTYPAAAVSSEPGPQQSAPPMSR